MFKTYSVEEFISSFKIKRNGTMAFLMGAGASASSGISTGGQMIWDFKREIYCNHFGIPTSTYNDLSNEVYQKEIQAYFDSLGDCPELYSSLEYSFYFEKCYPASRDRDFYIQEQVENVMPSLGYLCLGALVLEDKIKIVSTTNFDNLIDSGVKTLNPSFPIKTISSAMKNSAGFTLADQYPAIIKLHGDYLVDSLKNTSEELKELENEVKTIWKEGIKDKGLIVIGYSGNDDSIMNVLNELIESNSLPYGLIWCSLKGSKLNEKVTNLMDKACASNEYSGLVEIDNFDSILYRLYLSINKKYSQIEKIENSEFELQSFKFGKLNKYPDFVKTNSFESIEYPTKCYTFKTTIQSWKELSEYKSNDYSLALYNGKIWAIGDKLALEKTLTNVILSDIEYIDIPKSMFYKENSIILGLFYDLIKKHFENVDLLEYKKNKYFDTTSKKDNKQYYQYEALEVALSFINNKLYLTCLPTVHLTLKNGNELPRNEYQKQINRILSTRYNASSSDLLKWWTKKIIVNKEINVGLKDANLKFNKIAISYGGKNRPIEWPSKDFYLIDEPKLKFSYDDNINLTSTNQLKGLKIYGPIDSQNKKHQNDIRVAILAPKEDTLKVISHLENLKNQLSPKSEKEYLPEYSGFDKIFRRGIDIPNVSNEKLVRCYDGVKAQKLNYKTFFNGLKKYVDIFVRNITEFDILVIYIPARFSHLREYKDELEYFNLHDSLKLYCAEKNVVIQMMEEKSLNINTKNDLAKIMWGLSTAIYTKAIGQLWMPCTLSHDTAYLGLSYAQSMKNGSNVSIGCSQLFDSSGRGLKLYVRPIKDPKIIQRNPYMSKDDACSLMSNIKSIYDNSIPINKLNRLVIHKTTAFTKDEIEGIKLGLKGINNIELIRIQEFSKWRAYRFFGNDFGKIHSYPIQRGTIMPLDDNSFLLWTHGSVSDNEIGGNRNYFKNSRSIPAPLLIKRYLGKSDISIIANEIMFLTKMNWNSGDSLYKLLPVTIDFSKRLSQIAKQELVIYDKPYDFRYFM